MWETSISNSAMTSSWSSVNDNYKSESFRILTSYIHTWSTLTNLLFFFCGTLRPELEGFMRKSIMRSMMDGFVPLRSMSSTSQICFRPGIVILHEENRPKFHTCDIAVLLLGGKYKCQLLPFLTPLWSWRKAKVLKTGVNRYRADTDYKGTKFERPWLKQCVKKKSHTYIRHGNEQVLVFKGSSRLLKNAKGLGGHVRPLEGLRGTPLWRSQGKAPWYCCLFKSTKMPFPVNISHDFDHETFS